MAKSGDAGLRTSMKYSISFLLRSSGLRRMFSHLRLQTINVVLPLVASPRPPPAGYSMTNGVPFSRALDASCQRYPPLDVLLRPSVARSNRPISTQLYVGIGSPSVTTGAGGDKPASAARWRSSLRLASLSLFLK